MLLTRHFVDAIHKPRIKDSQYVAQAVVIPARSVRRALVVILVAVVAVKLEVAVANLVESAQIP